jgi:hypothetical protein
MPRWRVVLPRRLRNTPRDDSSRSTPGATHRDRPRESAAAARQQTITAEDILLHSRPRSTPPSASDAVSSTLLEGQDAIADDNGVSCEALWPRAFRLFRKREPGLAEDYEKHLRAHHPEMGHGTGLLGRDFIDTVVTHLLDDREKRQWQVSFMGKDVMVRDQIEKLVKFVVWVDETVKPAVGAQPYAALAWSGVTLLIPVRNEPLSLLSCAKGPNSCSRAVPYKTKPC